jgi:hypothetical protein
VARKKQAEDDAQITGATPDDEGPAPTGDIANAWLDELSEELTWADLTRWLSEAG